ncbi:hypothetical protein [Streptomyces bauhiniae]|uniref:hypothetical protein n=1 Tax=Streptomyces bauhiniae TaxID=2340725 RepID=UPI003658DB29
MGTLLDDVVEAAGGRDRWTATRSVSADAVSGGELLDRKAPQDPQTRRITASAHEQRALTVPAGGPDRRVNFHSDRVAIEDLEGRFVADQYGVEKTFEGHTLDTPWTPFQRAHFGGYAMWNYLTTPFTLTFPGVQTWEIEPLEEEGETWRGLRAVMPSRFVTHSRAQEFYFGPDLLLRRHDYTVDIAGGFRAANYASEHVEVDGLIIPGRRRAYMCDKNYRVLRDRLMIWIDFSDFSTD